MKRLAFFLLLTTTAWAQERPVHTFSIVARDQQTGELGWRCSRIGSRCGRLCRGRKRASAPSRHNRSLIRAMGSWAWI